jgi:hypothetical protein
MDCERGCPRVWNDVVHNQGFYASEMLYEPELLRYTSRRSVWLNAKTEAGAIREAKTIHKVKAAERDAAWEKASAAYGYTDAYGAWTAESRQI